MVISSLYKKYKTQLHNFGYLSILQFLSLALPLLTYPYLIRVLGASLYGKVVFAQAAMAYFSIIINYGFNISGTKDVSVYRDDESRLSKIVSSIFTAKILLWLLSLLTLIGVILFVPLFQDDKLLYLLSFGVCFNELLFQQYFFQGIEKMKYITIINAIARVLFFVFIFILVRKPEDYLLVPILNMLGALFGGGFALYFITRVEQIKLHIPSFSDVLTVFKSSGPFFLSRFSSVVINKTNTILLGGFVGYVEVAYYDLAQKVLTVLLIPFDLMNQVTYPSVARTKDMSFVKRIMKFVLILSISLYILTLLFSKYIVLLLGGVEMLPAVTILCLLSVNVIFTSQTYFAGNTVLVVQEFYKAFNLSVVFTSIFYLIFNCTLILTNSISLYTMVLSAVLSELFCLLYRFYYIKKYRLLW